MNEDKKIENNVEVKNKLSIKKPVIIFGATVATLLVGYFAYDMTRYQSTDDAYVETHTVQVAPKVSGQIVEVLVTDNQRIKEGDIVAKIDSIDYQVKLDQAEANYQKALLDQQNAKANFNAVNSEIALAKKDLERYTNLYEAGAVSKQALDQAQIKYDGMIARKVNAEQALMSKNNNKVADANIKVLKALRDQAELALSYTTIYAPQTGTVSGKRVEKGAMVQAGSPLFVLVPDKIWVVANYKENQLRGIKPGQPVDIKVDAYPGKVFKGKVDSIQRSSGAKASMFPPENAVGSFVKIVQRVPVKIVFDENIDPNEYTIVAGMSVVPKVRIK